MTAKTPEPLSIDEADWSQEWQYHHLKHLGHF
jgi:hypothetical protein